MKKPDKLNGQSFGLPSPDLLYFCKYLKANLLWWSQVGTETELWEKSYDVDRKNSPQSPYTFTVLAVLLLIGGALSTLQMAKDIFPAINIPVVGIIWTYANPDGRLFDGMYAQAKFALKNPTSWYRIIPWRIGKRRVPHRTKDTSSLKPPVKIDVCLMACENRAIIGYEAPYENSSSSPDVCTESDPQRSQSENSTGGNYET